MNFLHRNALFGVMEIASRLPLVLAMGMVARLTGPEVFGTWVIVLMMQALLSGICGMGLSTALLRFAPTADQGAARGLLLLCLAVPLPVFLLVFVVFLFVHQSVGAWLSMPAELTAVLVPAVLLGLATMVEGILDAFFKARQMFRHQLVFLTGRSLLEVAIVGGIYLYSRATAPPPDEILVLYIAATVTSRLMFYGLLTAAVKGKVQWPDRAHLVRMIRIGSAVLVSFLLVWAMTQGDRLIVAALAMPADVGVYGFGAVLGGYMIYVSYGIFPLMLPRAIQHYDGGDFNGLRHLTVEAQSLYLAVMGPGLLFLSLFAPEVILLTGGAAYLTAAPVIIALAVAIGLDHLTVVYEWTFLLANRARLIAWTALLHAVLRLSAFGLIALAIGVVDAVWAIPAATAVFAVLRLVLSRRLVRLAVPPSLLVGLAAVIAAVALGLTLADQPLWMRVALFAALGLPPLGAAAVKILTSQWPVPARFRPAS